MSTRIINRTDRLELIERLLVEHPTGLRAVELARQCGVDRRTIYRDISVLTENGLPVYQKTGRFCINREYYQLGLRLNQHEAMALFMALRVLAHHSDQNNPHVLSAMRKLGDAMSELPAKHIDHLTETMHNAPVDRGFVSVLETITRAWSEQRIVKLWYSSSKRETLSREFATYFLELTPTGEIYAVGYDSFYQRVRALKLRRIMRARILRTAYQVPAQFNPHRYLANAWGGVGEEDTASAEVILKVSAEVAPIIIQQLWHPNQRIVRHNDGYSLISLQISDWRAMLPWIRSWGGQIEVLQPSVLRQELRQEAQNIARMYGNETKRATLNSE
ncbi:MAG: WYL domain-containing protein [Aggregatilineales bacterium]